MSLNDGEVFDRREKLREVFDRREKQRRLKMYKNAGIKSKKEAAQRLIDGEVFYCAGRKIKFDPSCVNPFRFETVNIYVWDMYADWQIKPEWYENLGEGRLCWVWDADGAPGQRVAIVVKYEVGNKFGTASVWWRYAEPLTDEELAKYGGGEK